MKRYKKFLLFSFLTLSTANTSACVLSLPNQKGVSPNSIKTKINDPKRSIIFESYKTNSFTFDSSLTQKTGEINLLSFSQKNQNFLFPFAK